MAKEQNAAEQDPVINIDEVDTNKLREVISQFNELPIWKGEKKLRIAGVKKEAMRDGFIAAVEGLPKEKLAKLPEHLGFYYNYLVLTIVPEELAVLNKMGLVAPKEEEEAPAEEKKEPEKAVEKKPEPKKAPEKKAEEKKAPEKKAEPKKTPPPKKPAKESRTLIFKKLMEEGGGTRQELTEKMHKLYGGTEAESKFQVWANTRLLLTFGYAKMDEAGKITMARK